MTTSAAGRRPFVALPCLQGQCAACKGAAGRCDCTCHVAAATSRAALLAMLGINRGEGA